MLLKNVANCKYLTITQISDDMGEMGTLTQLVGVQINTLGRNLAFSFFGKMEDA